MRKVVYFLAASLDGFIARKDGSVDWLKMEDLSEAADEFTAFTNSVDTVLYGRKTFEKGLELDASGSGFKGFTNYVFSKTLEDIEIEGTEVVNSNPALFVTDLKKQDGKNIWLMGGGEIASSILNAGLIDEIVISLQPVILGSGIPIFNDAAEQLSMKVTDIRTRKSGSVQITYSV